MSGGVKVAREELHVAFAAYGSFSGAGVSLPRARVWVFAEPASNSGQLRIAYNDSRGQVEWRDLGEVVAVSVHPNRWMLTLADGRGATLVPAPCVCGAGAVGHAGPSGGPHRVVGVRVDQLAWVNQR